MTITHALTQAFTLALVLAAPILIVVFAVGLVSGLLQTLTQVRERAISAVPKILAALAACAIAGPWMGGKLLVFARAVLEMIPVVGRT